LFWWSGSEHPSVDGATISDRGRAGRDHRA
jgi:hypothetical protein